MTRNTSTDALHELYSRLNATDQEVASLGSKVDQIITTLDRVVERVTAPAPPPPKTDWVGIAALVVSIVSAGAFYLQSRFTPVEAQLEVQRTQMEKSLDRELLREREIGRLEAQLEAHSDDTRRTPGAAL